MEKKKCSVEKSKEYIPKDKMLRKCNIWVMRDSIQVWKSEEEGCLNEDLIKSQSTKG
jgi:hypothetical protein